MNIDESSTGKLLDFVQYDYRQFAVAVVLVELSEGPEVANRLLDGLPTAQLRKNYQMFVDPLREAFGMEEVVTGGS